MLPPNDQKKFHTYFKDIFKFSACTECCQENMLFFSTDQFSIEDWAQKNDFVIDFLMTNWIGQLKWPLDKLKDQKKIDCETTLVKYKNEG